MKIVKLTFPPESWDLAKHSPSGTCEWGGYKFLLNQEVEECDYWLVCGNLVFDTEKTIVSLENIVFDTSESADIVVYNSLFLKQFAYVSSFRTDLMHNNLISSEPIIPWFTKKNYDCFSAKSRINKIKKISLLASDKKASINHIKRLNFVKKLKEYFGEEIDFYGAGFTEFISDKTPTLEPYEFSIILETITDKDYFSEKLGDCYLNDSYPIYYGCQNLNQYFPENSFEQIDINDFEKSVETIKKIINTENYYQQHHDTLLKAKELYLNQYSIFPVMAKILDKVAEKNINKSISPKKGITLKKFYIRKGLFYYFRGIRTKIYDLLNL
jgi:hypothetical protein